MSPILHHLTLFNPISVPQTHFFSYTGKVIDSNQTTLIIITIKALNTTTFRLLLGWIF